ncbi:MAG TPA: hypothetical protein VMG41_07295 [Gemmatimonadales bacterium]|nr:hypothetical protein [Gemmatimonadales bacterium]
MVRSAALATLLLAGAASARRAAAQGRDWSPDDRTIIGDCNHVLAVAVSRDRVYVVCPSTLLEWDPASRRWTGSWSPPAPQLLSGVAGALADPLDGSVWLVASQGWARFDPALRQWDQGTVPAGVMEGVLDGAAPGSGLYLRTAAGWYLAGRGGFAHPATPPLRPVRIAAVSDAFRANPAIQANSSFLLARTRLHAVQYTAAAQSDGFTGRGWYVGTTGVGLLYFPEGAALPDVIPCGLPTGRVTAVFAAPGGVWAATERTAAADPGLTFVPSDLGSFETFQGPPATGLPFTAARRIIGRESELWLATDVGVLRVAPASGQVQRYDAGSLPDLPVLDLAQRRGRVVAATARGISEYTDSTGFVRRAPEFRDPALAVALAVGDTVWVGTQLGLFASFPGDSDLEQPAAIGESQTLRGPVVALAWRGDTLVGLLADQLLWRPPNGDRFVLGPRLPGTLGQLHAIVNGPDGLYIAGKLGVAFLTLETPFAGALTVPRDIPGEVTDIAIDDDYLWVATREGLMRFRRELIGR